MLPRIRSSRPSGTQKSEESYPEVGGADGGGGHGEACSAGGPNVLCLELGRGYTGARVGEKASKCPLEISALYVRYTSTKK